MIAVWILGLVVGVIIAAAGSRRAVGSALEVVDELGVSASFIGVTVMAIGTDLPEIANSIMASLSDHGDLNVGDSTGSALTQVTLILAVLILAAGLSSNLGHKETQVAVPIGLMTVGALVLLTILISDGMLSRLNGVTMVALWFAAITVLERFSRDGNQPPRIPTGHAGKSILATLGWLIVVGGAAAVIVRSFVEITEILGVPEYIASLIVLAFGTSVPELVVDWTAIRRGAAALAIGDLFGATLIDATMSVGIGPIFRPTAISSEAVTGTLVIAIGIAVTTLLVAFVVSRRALAGSLIAVYVLSMATLVTLAG